MQPGTEIDNKAWPILIIPYTKSGQIFVCPSTSAGQQFKVDSDLIFGGAGNTTYYGTTSNLLSGSAGTDVKLLSYARNCIPRGGTSTSTKTWFTPGFYYAAQAGRSGFVGYNSSNISTTTPLLEAAIPDSAGTIHIVDSMASSNIGDSIRAITSEARTDRFPYAEDSKVAYRHFYGFNALFGDGHVKWRRYFSTTANEWTIQDDNPDGSLRN